MGTTIDAGVFHTDTVVGQMEAFLEKHADHRRPEATVEPAEFVDKVAPNFGMFIEGYLVMVYNEHYEGHNPVLNFLHSAHTYYFGASDLYSLIGVIDDIFDWLGGDDVPGGAPELDTETAKELGLDYPEEHYDD